MTAFLCLHSLQGISSCSQVGSLRTQTTEEDRSTDREYHLGKQKEKRATMTSVFFLFLACRAVVPHVGSPAQKSADFQNNGTIFLDNNAFVTNSMIGKIFNRDGIKRYEMIFTLNRFKITRTPLFLEKSD